MEGKDKFITELKNYLMERYGTDTSFVYGGEFEARKRNGAYELVKSDNPEISGFCLRKDLCRWAPGNSQSVLKDIQNFAENYNVKMELEPSPQVEIDGKRYLVTIFVDEGYAGDISIHFSEIPELKY